jgi:uncharacterized UBP type Zn finger protein
MKNIETPEKMWELFQEYRDWCKDNPYRVHDFVGKDGNSVERMKERPLTQNGFDNWLAQNGLISYNIDHYRYNLNGGYDEYVNVMKLIDSITKDDQLCGAMCGVYAHQITSKLLGLIEKTDNAHQVNEIRIIKN